MVVRCVWCNEELIYDSKKGYVHSDGSVYKEVNGKSDHCVLPRIERK